MSVSSSSPSNSSLDSPVHPCTDSTLSNLIGYVFSITKTVLLLPLSIFIFCLAYKRWRQQHSFTVTSHADIITYHQVTLEMLWFLGLAFFVAGLCTDLPELMKVALALNSMTFFGESYFHLLTCVERYLAVVHPITYVRFRNVRGVRFRNISIGCVWLLTLIWTGLTLLYYPFLPIIPFSCCLAISLVVIFFCSLSVLRVLIRPGPGDGGRDKERVDQSKRRAFFTMMAILGVLFLWFGGVLVSFTLSSSALLSPGARCVVKALSLCLNLPSSLVLPLLYLHRAGKLPCCCYKSG